MPRSIVKTGAGSRGPGFLLIVALLVYIIFSIATAVMTVKDCNPNGKHWSFVPPRWECEAPNNVSPN